MQVTNVVAVMIELDDPERMAKPPDKGWLAAIRASRRLFRH